MRIMRRGWGLSALVAASLILSNGALRADDAPVVHVKAVVKDGAVRLEAEANGAVRIHHVSPERESVRARAERCVDGRSGGSANRCLRSGEELSPGAVSAGEKPMVRVEILLSHGVEPRLERERFAGSRSAGLA